MASKWRLWRLLFIKDKFVSFTTGYRFWEGYLLIWWDGSLIGSAGKFELENTMLCWVFFLPRKLRSPFKKTWLNHVFGRRWVTIDMWHLSLTFGVFYLFLCPPVVWAVNFWAFCFGFLSVVTAWVQVNVEDLQDGTHRRLQANQESNRDIEIIGIPSFLYDLWVWGWVSGW